RLYGALDAGLVINPAGVENQIVGQMTQATSRTLKEEVTFDRTGVTSLDWVSYPVLRFAEHPDVTPVVVQRLEEPSTGAGEEVMGATAAAIANAFFDATGVRLRQYPMTPARVKAALAARAGPGIRLVSKDEGRPRASGDDNGGCGAGKPDSESRWAENLARTKRPAAPSRRACR